MNLIRTLLILLCFISAAHAEETLRSRLLGFETYNLTGATMEPTIHRDELVYANTDAYKNASPARGQIVAYRSRKFNGNIFIMRIVAVAGDTVAIKNGQLFVNGVAVVEPYVEPKRVRLPPSRTFALTQVPPNSVFVLGDNRDNANDSRFLGAVPLQDITGQITMAKESWLSGDFREVR